jgi:heme O synthase-like polyprenyltransferase
LRSKKALKTAAIISAVLATFFLYLFVGTFFVPLNPANPHNSALLVHCIQLGALVLICLFAFVGGRSWAAATGRSARDSAWRMFLYSVGGIAVIFGLIIVAQQFRR